VPADGEAEITELYKLGMFSNGTPERLEIRRCEALTVESMECLDGGSTIEPVLERCNSGGTCCADCTDWMNVDGADGAEPT
jgi:hypothetical protein